MYSGVAASVHTFLTSALNGGALSRSFTVDAYQRVTKFNEEDYYKVKLGATSSPQIPAYSVLLLCFSPLIHSESPRNLKFFLHVFETVEFRHI